MPRSADSSPAGASPQPNAPLSSVEADRGVTDAGSAEGDTDLLSEDELTAAAGAGGTAVYWRDPGFFDDDLS